MSQERPKPSTPMEPKRMVPNPYNVWTPQMFRSLIDHICSEEINAMVQFGHAPPDEDHLEEIYRLALYNVNFYAHPAGNA